MERHIEMDSDHHSNLALEKTFKLCGTDANFWQEAEEASIKSMQQRLALWNGIHDAIVLKKEKMITS